MTGAQLLDRWIKYNRWFNTVFNKAEDGDPRAKRRAKRLMQLTRDIKNRLGILYEDSNFNGPIDNPSNIDYDAMLKFLGEHNFNHLQKCDLELGILTSSLRSLSNLSRAIEPFEYKANVFLDGDHNIYLEWWDDENKQHRICFKKNSYEIFFESTGAELNGIDINKLIEELKTIMAVNQITPKRHYRGYRAWHFGSFDDLIVVAKTPQDAWTYVLDIWAKDDVETKKDLLDSKVEGFYMTSFITTTNGKYKMITDIVDEYEKFNGKDKAFLAGYLPKKLKI